VVQDESHSGASPQLALAAHLAPRLLEALREQATFEMPPWIRRLFDEDVG
jgi:hypothetical protein